MSKKKKLNKSIAHAYDPITYKYIGEIQCWESPREPGVYLQPEDTTYVTPPSARDGFNIFWNPKTNAWYYKIDFTNKELYDVRNGGLVHNPIEEDQKYYTELKPPHQFCFWKDNKWEVDVREIKKLILPLIQQNGLIYNYFLNGPINIPGIGEINGNTETLIFLKDVREMLTNKGENTLEKFRMYDNTYRNLKLEEVFTCIFILQKSLLEDKLELMAIKDKILETKTMDELNQLIIVVDDPNKTRKAVGMQDVIPALIGNDELRLLELFSFR